MSLTWRTTHRTFTVSTSEWLELVAAMTDTGMVKDSAHPGVLPLPPADLTDHVWYGLVDLVAHAAERHDAALDPDLGDVDLLALGAQCWSQVGFGDFTITARDVLTFELWEAEVAAVRSMHDASVPGIAAHKLADPTGWHITVEEAQGALVTWRALDRESRALAHETTGPAWAQWLAFLEDACAFAGCAVDQVPVPRWSIVTPSQGRASASPR